MSKAIEQVYTSLVKDFSQEQWQAQKERSRGYRHDMAGISAPYNSGENTRNLRKYKIIQWCQTILQAKGKY